MSECETHLLEFPCRRFLFPGIKGALRLHETHKQVQISTSVSWSCCQHSPHTHPREALLRKLHMKESRLKALESASSFLFPLSSIQCVLVSPRQPCLKGWLHLSLLLYSELAEIGCEGQPLASFYPCVFWAVPKLLHVLALVSVLLQELSFALSDTGFKDSVLGLSQLIFLWIMVASS